MRILYVSSTISDSLLNQLYSKENRPSYQGQIFHNLIIHGIEENKMNLCCYSSIPTSKQLIKKTIMTISNEPPFIYSKIINIPIIKDIYIYFHTKKQIKKEMKKNSDVICICDCLSVTNTLATTRICKKYKKQCIGILTDIPEFIVTDKLYLFLVNKAIRSCTDYVFLTEPMNEKINIDNKPYVIMEGLCTSKIPQELTKRKNVFLYAGTLDKLNGIESLIQAFSSLDSSYELWLYGEGDYASEVIKFSEIYNNIKFKGLISHDEILKILPQVKFLLNPRKLDNEMIKYSFPSKNMEYLASGTPFISTKLPCIPDEYFNYINLFDDDTTDGIRDGILKYLEMDYTLLLEKAKKGQDFVLAKKSTKAQAATILSLVKKL